MNFSKENILGTRESNKMYLYTLWHDYAVAFVWDQLQTNNYDTFLNDVLWCLSTFTLLMYQFKTTKNIHYNALQLI